MHKKCAHGVEILQKVDVFVVFLETSTQLIQQKYFVRRYHNIILRSLNAKNLLRH